MRAWLTRSRRQLGERVEGWLLRLPRNEALPLELGQRRIYVLPSASGYGLFGTLLVMLVASINYELALGYALTFLLGGAAVASIVHTFRNLQGLQLAAARTEPVFLGQPATFELELHNRRPLPRPAITLSLDGALQRVHVPPHGSAAARLPLPTRQRGWLTAGRLVVDTRFPLGFIRAWSVLHPDLRVLVYPRPEALPPALPGMDGGQPARAASAARGDDDFAGLRAHQLADSPRHVAWKAVARGGPMLVKQFAADSGRELELDWSHLPPQLGTEQRLSRLAAWLLMAERGGHSYLLRLPGGSLGPARGAGHLQACLTRLALFGSPGDAH